MGTLKTIIEHGLSVRQIPEKVEEWLSYYEGKRVPDGYELRERDGRTYMFRVRIPVNAGCWMVQKCDHTGTMQRWSLDEHGAESTLEKAVARWTEENRTD